MKFIYAIAWPPVKLSSECVIALPLNDIDINIMFYHKWLFTTDSAIKQAYVILEH